MPSRMMKMVITIETIVPNRGFTKVNTTPNMPAMIKEIIPQII
jgi:hypothetical protein